MTSQSWNWRQESSGNTTRDNMSVAIQNIKHNFFFNICSAWKSIPIEDTKTTREMRTDNQRNWLWSDNQSDNQILSSLTSFRFERAPPLKIRIGESRRRPERLEQILFKETGRSILYSATYRQPCKSTPIEESNWGTSEKSGDMRTATVLNETGRWSSSTSRQPSESIQIEYRNVTSPRKTANEVRIDGYSKI